ncbi:MAG: SUMF1/EgtB/PvdO family nonheme iron enzyme [Acidobacteriota bacterium]
MQEVRDTLMLNVGKAFVEYNHRFVCPHCQTHNQIVLTREMFDNAQVMILHEAPPKPNYQNQPPVETPPVNDHFAGGGAPAFEPIMEDWAAPLPETKFESPGPSPEPFDLPISPPGEASAPAGNMGFRAGVPSFEADAAISTPPKREPPITPPPAKVSPPKPSRRKVDDDEFDADSEGLNLADLLNKKPAKQDVTNMRTGGKIGAAASGAGQSRQSRGLPSSIKLGSLEIPVNQKTMLVGGGVLVVMAVLGWFILGRSPQPTPTPAPPAQPATTPAVGKGLDPKPQTTPGNTTEVPNTSETPTATTTPSTTDVVDGMIDIPAGEYFIGRNDGTEYDRPQHKVTLSAFSIDVHEVTQAEYAKFLAATSHKPPASWQGGKYKGDGRLPVTEVNWNDASAYAKWAGKRLPTEAEWEVAAAGVEHQLYPWGNQWDATRAHTKSTGLDGPRPVGLLTQGRSPFGVYDMCGNVWEWTNSEPQAYPGGNRIDNAKELRVIRGGSYKDVPDVVTTSRRNWVGVTTADLTLGFRCAKDKQ